MDDAGPITSYPPATSTWQFAPRPRPRRTWWIAAAVALVVLGGAGRVVLGLYADAQPRPDTIDDPALTRIVDEQCRIMTATVGSLPVTGSAQRQSSTILDQNRAVEAMVDAIRDDAGSAVRDDPPTGPWLDDWERLVAARATLARALLRDPNASLVVPRDRDGDPITTRMDRVWRGTPVCVVPPALATADNDALSG